MEKELKQYIGNVDEFIALSKAKIADLQARCDRYEKALLDLRSYALGCSNDGSYIDHDSIIERIDEALNGEGETRAPSLMTG